MKIWLQWIGLMMTLVLVSCVTADYPAVLRHGTPDEIKAEAIRIARSDIAANKMRICIAGTRGTCAVGIPSEKEAAIHNLPQWQMPCGCTEPLAKAGIIFAEAYNREILAQMDSKTKAPTKP